MNNPYQELIQKAVDEGIEKFVVGSAILNGETLLIVIRSDADDFLSGYAEIPGGGVEIGESLIDALHRETKEETGLNIDEIIGYAGGFDYLSGSGKKTRQFNFIVKPVGFEIVLNPEEHSHYVWIHLDDTKKMEQVNMTHEMRDSILDIHRYVQSY